MSKSYISKICFILLDSLHLSSTLGCGQLCVFFLSCTANKKRRNCINYPLRLVAKVCLFSIRMQQQHISMLLLVLKMYQDHTISFYLCKWTAQVMTVCINSYECVYVCTSHPVLSVAAGICTLLGSWCKVSQHSAHSTWCSHHPIACKHTKTLMVTLDLLTVGFV